jgi:hypothetical protein
VSDPPAAMPLLIERQMHFGWRLSLLLVVSWAPLALLETHIDGPELVGYLGPALIWLAARYWSIKSQHPTDHQG